MTLQVAAATATILMLSTFVLYFVRRLGADTQTLPVTTEWLNELSVDRYLPMTRLLETTDFRFLSQQQGYTPEMGKRLRQQRAHAFRGYLQLLESDFNRVAAALRLLLAHSTYDRPELASALLHRRLTFIYRVMEAQVRLSLFSMGWDGVDGTELIRLFDGMRLELRTLVPESSMALA
jgi:hypothetical protein